MVSAPLPGPPTLTREEEDALIEVRRAIVDAASRLPVTSPWRGRLVRFGAALARILGRRHLDA